MQHTPHRYSHHKTFRRSIIATLVSLAAAQAAQASSVRDDIDYQLYRDFAENKGKFTIGATRIPVNKKDGTPMGNVLPDDIPMPDFSPVARNGGYSTLIDDQYLVSVAHNGGYQNIQFGHAGSNPDQHTYSYRLVDRNEYPKQPKPALDPDYHIPRIHKLVTETAPATPSDVGSSPDKANNPYFDKQRFATYVRLGSGSQFIRNSSGVNTSLGGAYNYRTGGNTLKLVGAQDGWIGFSDSDWFKSHYTATPLPSHISSGDSGSPIFGYDNLLKKWVVTGTVVFNDGNNGSWYGGALMRPDFHANKMAEDRTTPLHNTQRGAVYHWESNGNTSTIKKQGSNDSAAIVKLADTSLAKDVDQLNHGQTLHLTGENATLKLNQSINQGAGALYFSGNYTVAGTSDDVTHQGAGISVAADKTVTWQVKNPENDRLSKIGAGTLLVNGTGINAGSISVGDGTVILAQKADAAGNKQAFKELGIVSGRPTVVLDSPQQMDLDNVYFGYRGGRLDANGKNIAFHYIQNVDDGAQIVNHANHKATVTVSPKPPALLKEDQILWSKWGEQTKGLYEYINNYAGGRTDYFVFVSNREGYKFFPTDATSNAAWEYLGSDKTKAINTYLARENAKRIVPRQDVYHGWLGETDQQKNNGAMDFQYQGALDDDILTITGGTQINGDVRVSRGSLLLSGRPTPHAYDHQNKIEPFKEDDWLTRNFQATQFIAQDKGKLYFGRNVGSVTGDVVVRDHAEAVVGYVAGKTPVCLRSDHTGDVSCQINNPNAISPAVANNLTATSLLGNATLDDMGTLTLGKTNFAGSLKASPYSTLNLQKDALWHMPSDHTLGNLTGNDGRIIVHANDPKTHQDYRTLTINGMLSGSLNFDLKTDLANHLGDQIMVNGVATGKHTLSVQNTAAEPSSAKRLTLIKLNHGAQDASQININLAQNHVDAGTWRYTLAHNDQHEYYLHNPIKEQEIADQLTAEKKRLADEAAAELEKLKNAAQAAQAAAEETIKTATQKQQAAQAAAEQAEQKLAQAQQTLNNLQQQNQQEQLAKQQAQADADAARAKLTEAQAALTQANQDLAAQITANQQAQTDLQAAQQAVKQAETELQQQNATHASSLKTAQDLAAQAQAQAKQAQAAQMAAEAAKKTAEAQAAQAIADAAAAQATITAAQVAQKNAEAAAQQAQLDKQNALAAQAQAQAAQKTAEANAAQAIAQAQTALQAQKDAESKLAQTTTHTQAAQDAAKTAQIAAEKAQAQAKADQQAAKVAQTAAENAQKAAEIATINANKQKAAAQAAQQQAQAAQNDAKIQLAAAQTAQQQAANAMQAATEAKKAADLALANAQKEKAAAEAIAKANSIAQQNTSQSNQTAITPPQAKLVSKYANTALSELSAQAQDAMHIGHRLDARLLATDNQQDGIWLATNQQKTKYASDYYRGYHNDAVLSQFGVDKTVQTEPVQLTLGTVFSHSRGKQAFDEAQGESKLNMISAYSKAKLNNDLILSADIGLGQAQSKLLIDGQPTHIKRDVAQIGIKAGKQFHFNDVQVQPFVGARLHRLSGQNYTITSPDHAHMQVSNNHANILEYQAGLTVAKPFHLSPHVVITPSISSVYRDANRRTNITVNHHRLTQTFGRSWDNELALHAKIGAWSIKGQAAYTKNSESDSQKSFGASLTYHW